MVVKRSTFDIGDIRGLDATEKLDNRHGDVVGMRKVVKR
jgi:hypothetical protein